jgi:small subunit ribosomal protein S6
MRTYELIILADPRLTDEEMIQLTDDYKRMIAAGGGTVKREESWGRRKLAYSIQKLAEGRYVLLEVETSGAANPLPEVEHRLRQNDKVLRYLPVRTDGVPPPAPPREAAPPTRNGEAAS